MSTFKVVSQRTVAGTPGQCWQAILDEVEGRSRWWQPYVVQNIHPGQGADRLGSEIDIAANADGHPERVWGTATWVSRLTEMVPERRLTWEYVEGSFRGSITWTLAPVGDDHTHITVQWYADPTGANRVFASFYDEPADHARIMEYGFDGLESYIASHVRL